MNKFETSYVSGLVCLNCREEYPPENMTSGCPKCKTDQMISNLSVKYDYDEISSILTKDALEKRKENIWKYHPLLPVENAKHMISLGEGLTPLIHCKNLGNKYGFNQLFVKDESRNPTWSFKDRSCCVGVAKGLDFNAKVITIASTGNHGGSAAAYAARAGLESIIFTVVKIPKVQLTLMQIYGGKVIPVTTMEGRWELMSRGVRDFSWYPLSTYTKIMPTGNPYAVDGYKTIAYEICEQLNWKSPDKVIVPTGHAEGLFGIWKGFKEFFEIGLIEKTPIMVSVEPQSRAPLAEAIERNFSYPRRISTKPTVAFHIGSKICSYQGLTAIKESNGITVTVSDNEIIESYLSLAKQEGIWSEASSAATIAAFKKLLKKGKIDKDEIVVCVLTSAGIKDPEVARVSLLEPIEIEPNWNSFKRLIGKE